MRILVIDDNEAEADALKKLLKRRFDAEVFLAHTKREGKQIVEANNLDCIALDLQLKDSTIDQTIAWIPELPYPVFVYSGFDDPGLRKRVLDSGAEDFILKATGDASIVERIGHLQYKRKPDPKLLKGAFQARHDEPSRIMRSEWKGTIPRVAAGVVSVVMFIGGLVTGGWKTASDQGRQNESDRQHFVKLDEAITEMKEAGKSRDALLDRISERVTRGESERQSIVERAKIQNDAILDWLKRIEFKLDSNLMQPPHTTKR